MCDDSLFSDVSIGDVLNQRTVDTPANKNHLSSLLDVTSHFDLQFTVDLASGVCITNCLPDKGTDIESAVDLASGNLPCETQYLLIMLVITFTIHANHIIH